MENLSNKATDLLKRITDKLPEKEKAMNFIKDKVMENKQTVATIALFAASELALYLYTKWLRRVPKKTFLELDLDNKIIVEELKDGLELLNPQMVSLRDLVDAVNKAAKDTRVAGIVCRLGNVEATLVAMQELREAIVKFGETGKHTIVHSTSLIEYGNGLKFYWFATAFKEIYVPSCGMISITGIKMDQPFLKGTLEKLDITPSFLRRKEYKGATETFTEKQMTPEAREVLQAIHDTIMNQFVSDIAKSRNLDEMSVRRFIENGPYMCTTALNLKLIDGIMYDDELYTNVLPLRAEVASSKNLNLIYATQYIKSVGRSYRKGKPTIAVVDVIGAIYQGESDEYFGSKMAGSGTVIRGIRQAVANKDVKAIILKVDSPGGSYVASDCICREIVRAKKSGKKVIAWMGQLAASGGYYVSCNADYIIAMPLTITGSIGVYFGKMNTRGMWGKLGITYDGIKSSENANFFDSLEDWSEAEKESVNKILDYIYDDFTEKVSTGRNLPKDEVEQVAKGRIWTGKEALERKLVDELGDFNTAIAAAKRLAGIPETTKVKLEHYPKLQIMKLIFGPRNSREAAGPTQSLGGLLLQGFVKIMSHLSLLHSIPGFKEFARSIALMSIVFPRLVRNQVMAADMNLMFPQSLQLQ